MAQMRRIFYCRINLAILLIGRQIATILPQAAHRRARWRHGLVNSRSKDISGARSRRELERGHVREQPELLRQARR
jgi:hypothetical protein